MNEVFSPKMTSQPDTNWFVPRVKHKLNNIVFAVQGGKECSDLYVDETPLYKHKVQHRIASSTGEDSAVQTHLKDKGYF